LNGESEKDFPGLLSRQRHLATALFVFFGISSTLEGLTVQSSRLAVVGFLGNLLLLPLLLAGVIGQIQTFQDGGTRVNQRTFLGDVRHYSWRFLGINLCYLVLALIAGVLLRNPAPNPANARLPGKSELMTYLYWVPLGALVLFWRVAVVADDGKLFRSFWRNLRVLVNAPSALILGLGWGTLSTLDRVLGNHCSKPTLLKLAVLRAVVFAFAGLWVYSRALAIYQKTRVMRWKEATAAAEEEAVEQAEVRAPDRVGWPLILFALIPGINLLALIKGARLLRTSPQFSLRSAIACVIGGFSVLICLLALLAPLLPRTGAAAEKLLLPAASRLEMSPVANAVSYGIILLLLLTSHEYAHAFAAWKLGDNTAKDAGRLTLNPLAHVDIVGSLLLPGLLVWRHSNVVFGWAKPVPVDTTKFANPQRDHRIVSFAGPGINLAVSMASFLLLAVLFFVVRLVAPGALSDKLASPFDAAALVGIAGASWLLSVIVFLKNLMYTSLTLGFFNLLPLPPLDGGWIFSSVLPERARVRLESMRPYSFAVFLLLVFTHVTDYVLVIPLLMAYGGLTLMCAALGFS
jgi:Zn-dependent protease